MSRNKIVGWIKKKFGLGWVKWWVWLWIWCQVSLFEWVLKYNCCKASNGLILKNTKWKSFKKHTNDFIFWALYIETSFVIFWINFFSYLLISSKFCLFYMKCLLFLTTWSASKLQSFKLFFNGGLCNDVWISWQEVVPRSQTYKRRDQPERFRWWSPVRNLSQILEVERQK